MHNTTNPNSTGEFQEKEFGCYYTYRFTTDSWALSQGFIHEVDVLHGVRFAIVKRTVVKVLVDEGVTETWYIKNHHTYINAN